MSLGEADLDTDADLEYADLDDFGEPDDAELQALLAEENATSRPAVPVRA